MNHLRRIVVAEMLRNGRAYPELEAMVDSMEEPQLQDLLRLMREARNIPKERCRWCHMR